MADPADFYKALGARIRELRGTKISQEDVAKSSRLSRTSIVNIEAGRQRLLVHNLFQIANALCVRPTALLASLEPPLQEFPKIDIEGQDAGWIHRSVKKAIQNNPPHDSP